MSDPSVVAQIASEAGLDGAALVAAAQQPEAKAALRKQTDDAIAAACSACRRSWSMASCSSATTISRSSSASSPATISPAGDAGGMVDASKPIGGAAAFPVLTGPGRGGARRVLGARLGAQCTSFNVEPRRAGSGLL